MMNKEKISIKNISNIILKNAIVIIIMTLLFAVAGGIYAKHKQHTVYESERNIMTSHYYRGSSANEEVQADISLGKTYAKIIESDDVAKAARKQLPKSLRKKYSVNEISSMVNATPVLQTTIIKVRVKAKSAKESAVIVNAVTKSAVSIIHDKIPSPGKLSLFAKATESQAQSITSPSIKKYVLLGAAIGFLIGMIIAFSVTTWTTII